MPVLTNVADNNPELDFDVSFTDRRIDLVAEGIDLDDLGEQENLIGRRIGAGDAAVNGRGTAYLSTWLVADDVALGRLRILRIFIPKEDAPFIALWPKPRDLSPRIRVVVDALIEALMSSSSQ